MNLRLLTEKLYRRNPRELKKSGRATVDAGLARIFEGRHDWRFAELRGARGTDAIHLAFLSIFFLQEFVAVRRNAPIPYPEVPRRLPWRRQPSSISSSRAAGSANFCPRACAPLWKPSETATRIIDATSMSVLTALISGVTPLRTRPNT